MSSLRVARRKRRLCPVRRGARPRRLPPPLIAARTSGSLGLMEGQPFGENGVVTALETFDEPRLQRNAPFSRSVRDVTGAAQQPLHLARPLFFLDFDESLQFAQVMRIAQGVQHAFHRVIGLPVIVNDDADNIRQETAALGADAIEGQQGGGRDMQPLRLAADAKPRLVHVLHRRAGHEIAHRFGKAPQTFGASPAHSRDRRGGHFDAEQIGHQCGQTVLGQQLIVQQIDHEGRDSGAVLHRRVDAIGKRRARLRAAGGALAIVRTMFGDDERLRLGQIKYLTDAMANARFRVEAHAARRAGRRIMIDDVVGISDLSQGLAFVTLLPARLLAGTFAQTSHPRRLLQPIARRRLAAVRAVQSEPALKFGDPCFQRRIFSPQRRNQRDQLLPWTARLASRESSDS